MTMDVGKAVYENVAITDDHEESLSSTEVEESLMGDEKQWHSSNMAARRRSRRSKFISAFKTVKFFIDTFLLLVVIGLLLLLREQRNEMTEPGASWQVGGDYTGAGPSCRS